MQLKFLLSIFRNCRTETCLQKMCYLSLCIKVKRIIQYHLQQIFVFLKSVQAVCSVLRYPCHKVFLNASSETSFLHFKPIADFSIYIEHRIICLYKKAVIRLCANIILSFVYVLIAYLLYENVEEFLTQGRFLQNSLKTIGKCGNA